MKKTRLPKDWKIVTGTALFALAEAMPAVLPPAYSKYQPLVYIAAVLIGGVGVSARLNKIRQDIHPGGRAGR